MTEAMVCPERHPLSDRTCNPTLSASVRNVGPLHQVKWWGGALKTKFGMSLTADGNFGTAKRYVFEDMKGTHGVVFFLVRRRVRRDAFIADIQRRAGRRVVVV
jgi:hypothetical protein